MAVETIARTHVGERLPTAFVGRQPILRHDSELFAYELLFRDGDMTALDGCIATANVLTNSLLEIGLDRIAGKAKVFVNVTRNLLLNGDMSCLPPERFVLEILEDVRPDPEVLHSVSRLSDEGFTIALDDYFHQCDMQPLVELADIVKLELPAIDKQDVASQVGRLKDSGLVVLAEKVETQEEFQRCRDCGCDLFQGYFFCRPQLMSQRKPDANSQGVVRLLAELSDPEISLDRIESLLETDPSLCYRVLRYVNSASVRTTHEIGTIGHAITIMGIAKIRSLAAMMLMADVGEQKPNELLNVAMIRAKACEILSRALGLGNPDQAFTAGMISTFDGLLDMEIQDVVEMLPLSSDLNEALIRKSGDIGKILEYVLSHERGDLLPDNVIHHVQEAVVSATIWVADTVVQI